MQYESYSFLTKDDYKPEYTPQNGDLFMWTEKDVNEQNGICLFTWDRLIGFKRFSN